METTTMFQPESSQTTHIRSVFNFNDVITQFISHGWNIVKNTSTEIVFSHVSRPYDEFAMKVDFDTLTITVLIPLINYDTSYYTTFTNYLSASKYMLDHLENYHLTVAAQILPTSKEYDSD
jgi:hypothetical protein